MHVSVCKQATLQHLHDRWCSYIGVPGSIHPSHHWPTHVRVGMEMPAEGPPFCLR